MQNSSFAQSIHLLKITIEVLENKTALNEANSTKFALVIEKNVPGNKSDSSD